MHLLFNSLAMLSAFYSICELLGEWLRSHVSEQLQADQSVVLA